MAGRAYYINTDLDVASTDDLSALAAFLGKKKWSVLHADWHPDGFWLGIFEAPHVSRGSPEQTIAKMLKEIEALPGPLKAAWDACSRRDFNIGYESGTGGRPLEQSLSNALLHRVAAVGASVSVTIYPRRDDRA